MSFIQANGIAINPDQISLIDFRNEEQVTVTLGPNSVTVTGDDADKIRKTYGPPPPADHTKDAGAKDPGTTDHGSHGTDHGKDDTAKQAQTGTTHQPQTTIADPKRR